MFLRFIFWVGNSKNVIRTIQKKILTPFFVYLQEGETFLVFFAAELHIVIQAIAHLDTSRRILMLVKRTQQETCYLRDESKNIVKLDHHLDLNNMSKLKPSPPVIFFLQSHQKSGDSCLFVDLSCLPLLKRSKSSTASLMSPAHGLFAR